MVRVAAEDLFALADAILALTDEGTEFDVLWRRKVATELEKVYEKFLKAYREEARKWSKSSYKRAYPIK